MSVGSFCCGTAECTCCPSSQVQSPIVYTLHDNDNDDTKMMTETAILLLMLNIIPIMTTPTVMEYFKKKMNDSMCNKSYRYRYTFYYVCPIKAMFQQQS